MKGSVVEALRARAKVNMLSPAWLGKVERPGKPKRRELERDGWEENLGSSQFCATLMVASRSLERDCKGCAMIKMQARKQMGLILNGQKSICPYFQARVSSQAQREAAFPAAVPSPAHLPAPTPWPEDHPCLLCF